MLRKIIVITVMIFMLTANVFAEDIKTDIDNQNMSMEDINNIDNANLFVEVTKQTGEESTVIYTGRLGDYDNGAWNNVDFRTVPLLVVFDWDSAENEVIYIRPVSSQINISENDVLGGHQTVSNNYPISNIAAENFDSSLNANINLMYNNEYYESILKYNNTLNISFSIYNEGTETKELICYFAEYDIDGRLIAITGADTIHVSVENEAEVSITKTILDTDVVSAKILLWENVKKIL